LAHNKRGESLEDETIVQKLKKGDIQALKIVYELFYKSAFRAAFFITNDTGLAEDTVHETFLKLLKKIEQLEDPSKLEIWLCRMAINNARDIIRNRAKSTLIADAKGTYVNNPSTSPENILLENEEKQIIIRYIQQLQPEHKRVIFLKYYEDLSDNEISTTLGIPVGTVKSRLFYARKEIKRLFEPESQLNRHKLVDLKMREGVKDGAETLGRRTGKTN